MLRRIWHRTLQYANNSINQFRSEPGADVSESFYSRICLEKIQARLSDVDPDRYPLNILDAGCGMGAVAVPMAVAGHQVTGIDLHGPSLEVAGMKAKEAGTSLELVKADLLAGIKAVPTESIDAVVSLAVLYTCVHYREILKEIGRVLKPGGFLFGSFRTPHYFITTLLRKNKYDAAHFVAKNTEGTLRIATAPAYYNWQTPEQLRTILEESGLTPIGLEPCGIFTGAHGDGLAAIADISEMPGSVLHTIIYDLESHGSPDCVGASRYMFATAQKSSSPFSVAKGE